METRTGNPIGPRLCPAICYVKSAFSKITSPPTKGREKPSFCRHGEWAKRKQRIILEKEFTGSVYALNLYLRKASIILFTNEIGNDPYGIRLTNRGSRPLGGKLYD
jgi:hypothetical protein